MNLSAIRNPQSAMIKVLVVDDSAFMRNTLTHILQSDKSLEVIGTAADGIDAIQKVQHLRPDVVLLDIDMPKMDGLTALGHIMAEFPTPVVMLSGLVKKDGMLVIKSLEAGAVDFIPKPSGTISYDIDTISDEIITKVKIAAGVNVQKLERRLPHVPYSYHIPARPVRKGLVVIGASTGGPLAVKTILSSLWGNISASFIVVQHMCAEFIPSFAERLRWESSLKVSLAEKDEEIRPGRVLIAPGGCYTRVVKDGDLKKINISTEASVAGLHYIDCTMESAAEVYGDSVLGVLLTGMGNDGARGMKAIRAAGGSTIAEDPSTCVVYGMPKAAIEMGCVDEVVPLPMIAPAILLKI